MTSPPTLQTERLRLRPYSEADIPELLPLIGAREVAATTLRIAHLTKMSGWPAIVQSGSTKMRPARSSGAAVVLAKAPPSGEP